MVATSERSPATIIAASYERVSTRQQAQTGYSLVAQHQSLEGFAADNGWHLPEHLRFRDGEDADASGTRWDLPGLTAMLDAAHRGEFSVLIVPDLDRLARSLAKGLALEDQLRAYGVRVLYQRVPTEDTPEGRLLKHQLLSFAEYEREKIRLRMTLGKRTKASGGEVVGCGPAPYGYRYTRTTLPNGRQRVTGFAPEPAQAAVVERIFALLPTRSSIEVADQLNAEGVPAPRGERWLHAVVYAIARNRLYTGTWTYTKHAKWAAPGTGIEVAVPPIVSEAVWDEVQTALRRRQIIRRGQTPRDADPYLLRGLLTCGLCGHPLRTDRNGRVRYYLCACYKPSRARRAGKQPCALPAVHAEAMEGELWRVLSQTLLDPAYLAAGLESARAAREDANRTRQDRIAAYDRQIVAGRRTLNDIATQVLGALTDGGEFSAIIRQRVADSEKLIARFTAERDALAGLSAAGLTEDDAADIAAFSARMVAGMGAATTADKRALYELLRVRGTVTPAANGVRLGRKHRFTVDWTAALPLRDSASGLSNPDIPQLTRPGALGPFRVIDPVEPINAEAARLREQGADVIIAMGHMGVTGGTLTDPTGPVVDVTDQLEGVDAVVGDHTDMQVSAIRPNGTLLVENRSKGVMFTRVRFVIDVERGELIYRTADHHRPWNIGVTPDPEIAATLEQLEVDLAPTLGRVIGSAVQPIPRADACGMETGRTCESLIGNAITDALRMTYGTDFAITNSGGIRADLTCPPEGSDVCPTDAGELPITEGQVLTVLPFGNVAVTVEVSGAELKAMLEAGVAAMPEASGAFPQVSGLCFTYDIEAEPGSRVTGAVRQAADGSCSGEAIDLSETAIYTIATNDFTASGGDNYPAILSRANTRDLLASVVSAYIAGESPLSLPGEPLAPKIEGRIVCEGEGCPAPASG